jgi:hypothetical protein
VSAGVEFPPATDLRAARARVGGVVAEVVRQAVRDAGAAGVVLLDDATPEAVLAGEWCALGVGEDAVWRVPRPRPEEARSCLAALGAEADESASSFEEAHRLRCRLVAAARGALVAHPANKTVLLLAPPLPPEALLPLGDLYASQVAALAGAWTGPPALERLAHAVGGVEVLDAALHAWIEERRPFEALVESLGPRAAAEVRRAFEAGRFWRLRVGLVPKLGSRTLGIDLFG